MMIHIGIPGGLMEYHQILGILLENTNSTVNSWTTAFRRPWCFVHIGVVGWGGVGWGGVVHVIMFMWTCGRRTCFMLLCGYCKFSGTFHSCVMPRYGKFSGTFHSCVMPRYVSSLELSTHTSCYVTVSSLELSTHASCHAMVSSLELSTHASCHAIVSSRELSTHTSCYVAVSSLELSTHASCHAIVSSLEPSMHTSCYVPTFPAHKRWTGLGSLWKISCQLTWFWNTKTVGIRRCTRQWHNMCSCGAGVVP